MARKNFILLLLALLFLGLVAIVPSPYLRQEARTKPNEEKPTSTQVFPTQTPTPSPPKFQPLSLDQIFSNNHSWLGRLPKEKIWTLIATGDVMLGRTVNYQTVQTNDFIWPFEKTATLLERADVTFINLESPLVENCPPTSEGMIFCGDPRNLEGLKKAGIDVVNLANNHAGNYDTEGIKDTIDLLNHVNIPVTGTSGPVTKDVNGFRLSFLGYNDIPPFTSEITKASEDKIHHEISEAKKESDLVVIAFHWGEEYTSQPTRRQQELAHMAIDAGADLVIGHHPHWIQTIEIYKEKVVIYSHGNFVFDQMWSQKTREGIVSRTTFFDDQLIDVELLPVEIGEYGQPSLLSGARKSLILEKMKEESLNLAESK